MPEEKSIVYDSFIKYCEEELNFEELKKKTLIKIEILKEVYEEFKQLKLNIPAEILEMK